MNVHAMKMLLAILLLEKFKWTLIVYIRAVLLRIALKYCRYLDTIDTSNTLLKRISGTWSGAKDKESVGTE